MLDIDGTTQDIIEILEMVKIQSNGTVIFPEKARKLIHEVAELKRKNGHLKEIMERNAMVRKMYLEGITAGDIYKDMIAKIVAAPDNIFASATTILLCDIDDLLKIEKME